MTRTIAALLCMLVTLAGTPAWAQGAGGKHIRIALVAEMARPAAGRTVTLALDSTPAPGWHGYWVNGGDAGVPTLAYWTLPAGARAGELRYPVPGRLLISGLMNYVYERPFAPLVDLSIPAGLAVGTKLSIAVKLDYLVCTRELCVPETQSVATELTVGDGAIAPATRARFDAWRQALPKPLGSPARFQVEGGRFRLAVPFPAGVAAPDAYFYPLAGGALDYAAPQTVARDGDMLTLEAKAAGATAPAQLAGVLQIGEGRGFFVTATPGAVAAARSGWVATALLAFAGAVLGGLILNVMPCVFPILSLKALSLARSGGEGARAEALAYTAGVVAVCVALGGAILLLRAGGSAVGWAFQLQDPRMIAVLLALAVAIAANLSGLWEVPSLSFERAGGQAGAFATGALAAFVATPCTGPFMAAALGAALVLPWAAALLVFAGLGLGLALPFLLLGFVPALRRRLPKPGAWMERVRRVLAVPMWLTAAALVWLLAQLARGGDMLAVGVAVLVVVLLTMAGRRQHRGRSAGWLVAAALVAVPALGAAVVRPLSPVERGSGVDPAFSEAKLAQLRAQNRPVFAYFTADWCLTCKVNERVAIDPSRAALKTKGVAVLVGDWTGGDAALGRFIEAHNRAGVPLYLYYAPGQEARVLPQVLTPGMLAGL